MAQGLNAADRPSALPMAASAGTITLIATLAALGFALTVVAFFPGYLTNDATYVYQLHARSGVSATGSRR